MEREILLDSIAIWHQNNPFSYLQSESMKLGCVIISSLMLKRFEQLESLTQIMQNIIGLKYIRHDHNIIICFEISILGEFKEGFE